MDVPHPPTLTMSVNAFEKTNWGWQASQFQQQIGEWLEYQFSRFRVTLPEWTPDWFIAPWLLNLLNFLFWSLLSLFLVWVGWKLWQEFSPYLYAWQASLRRHPTIGGKTTKNELFITQLLVRSQELSRQRNYREACRCLYLALLQSLHEKAILPHKASRTDGEYLQLLQLTVTPLQPYETLITIHEQLCFSDREILSENFEQCRQAYQEISQQ